MANLNASSPVLHSSASPPASLPSSLAKSISWNDLDGLLFSTYGGVYILVSDLLLYPADLLTTKLQNDKTFASEKVSEGCFAGFCQQASHARQEEAEEQASKENILYISLYLALGSFPGQFLYYSSYEYANEKLRDWTGCRRPETISFMQDFFVHCGAGLVAELVSGLAYLPSDIVSQRLQIERRISFLHAKYTFRSAKDVIRYIWRTEGLKGFYRGYGIYLLVYGPSSAIWWSSYESTKNLLKQSVDRSGLALRHWPITSDLIHCFSGGFAGTLATILTHPLDLMRTRLQLLDVSSASERRTLELGLCSLLKSIHKEEGWSGYVKGLKPRIYLRGPGSALAFMGYEWLKQASKQ